MLKIKKYKRAVELRSQQFLQCRDQSVPITVIRSRRRRSKLTLQVGRKGVVLRAPFATSTVDIDTMLTRNREWIYERQQQFLSQQDAALSYIAGEHHDFLGKPRELKILVGKGRAKVGVDGDKIVLTGELEDSEQISRALQRWYQLQAQQVFSARLSHWAALLPWVEDIPVLRLRRMRSRWGSCSADGRICLNTHLIKASQVCIDYVIVHELCHLQEFNHSQQFYALMAEAMPDWKQHKAELESVGGRLIRE
jgi:predicted metal-dependent hydrolase